MIDGLLMQVAVVGGVLVCAFAGPFASIWFLTRRRAKDRARRRSPLTSELLRAPGQALSDQLHDVDADIWAWVMVLALLPTAIVCVHLAQSYLLSSPESIVRWVFLSAMVVGSIVIGVRKLHTLAERKDRLRLGLDGERAIAEELNQLMRSGAVVFHDVPGESFNVDHVVIAREGVFAVETKGYAKPNNGLGKADARVLFDGVRLTFPWGSTSKPLEQAERQAKWLSTWLSRASGSPVSALPVLTLPGWFVERTGRGGVRVFSGKELRSLLEARKGPPISDQDVQRLSYQVEQRCRTVAPEFAPPDEKAS